MRRTGGANPRRHNPKIVAAGTSNLLRLHGGCNDTIQSRLLRQHCTAQHCTRDGSRMTEPRPVLRIHAREHRHTDQLRTGDALLLRRAVQCL